MTDFSKQMDTSGFKFETLPNISKINHKLHSIHDTEIHLFQCKLRLTDKQLGYLRHNGNIIITDTRIITPSYWLELWKYSIIIAYVADCYFYAMYVSISLHKLNTNETFDTHT